MGLPTLPPILSTRTYCDPPFFTNASLLVQFLTFLSTKQPGKPEERNRKDAQALQEKVAKKKLMEDEAKKGGSSQTKVVRKKVAKKATPSLDTLLDSGLKKKSK